MFPHYLKVIGIRDHRNGIGQRESCNPMRIIECEINLDVSPAIKARKVGSEWSNAPESGCTRRDRSPIQQDARCERDKAILYSSRKRLSYSRILRRIKQDCESQGPTSMLFLQVESENHVGACRVIVIPVRNSVRPDSLDRRPLSPMRKKRGLSVVYVRVKKNSRHSSLR